jgi:TRAP-type C4-dicarboxylate transport system permease small subunit
MTAFIEACARFLTRIAAVFLLAMVAVNVLDVGLRGLFNIPFHGGYDLVTLFLSAVAFLAIPETFLRGEHITIELIDAVVSQRVVAFLKVFGLALTSVFVVLLTYYMIEPALEFARYNEVTLELQLPVIWKAIPVLAGFAFSIVAVLYLFVRELRDGSNAGDPEKGTP